MTEKEKKVLPKEVRELISEAPTTGEKLPPVFINHFLAYILKEEGRQKGMKPTQIIRHILTLHIFSLLEEMPMSLLNEKLNDYNNEHHQV